MKSGSYSNNTSSFTIVDEVTEKKRFKKRFKQKRFKKITIIKTTTMIVIYVSIIYAIFHNFFNYFL